MTSFQCTAKTPCSQTDPTGQDQPGSQWESEMEEAREEDSKFKDLSLSKTQVLKVTQLNSEPHPEEAYARGSRKFEP